MSQTTTKGEIVAEGIISAESLREYLGVFTPLVDEGRIHFNDDGLTGRVVDPANVCMIHPATLAVEAFESYDAPGAVTIGLNFDGLLTKVKPADADDLVHLAVDMETRRLRIRYDRADLTHHLIDPEGIRKEPDRTELDLPNWITIEGRDFDEALTFSDMVSDHLWLRADPDAMEVTFYAEGDLDDADYSLGDEDLIEGRIGRATESVFSLDYLEDLAKPIPADAEVTLRFGDEFPLEIEWEGADGALNVEGVLAPRIISN